MMPLREAKVKVCLIGEQGVGKTTLVYRFVKNEFRGDYLRTLGTQVSKRSLTVADPVGGETRVDIMVWDIMGEKGFMDLVADAYFYGAHGILAVFDVTRRETGQALERWIIQAQQVTGNVPVVVLGNKSDLLPAGGEASGLFPRVKSESVAEKFLTSAKTGQNVERAFQLLVETNLARRRGPHPDPRLASPARAP